MILTLEDKSLRMVSDGKLVKHIDYNKKEFKELFRHITNMMQKEQFNDHNMDEIVF